MALARTPNDDGPARHVDSGAPWRTIPKGNSKAIVGPENRNSLISLRIFRYQSPPITDSVWPQLSISVIVTGRRNQPFEMSMRSLRLFLAGLFATAFRPRLSLQLEVVALRHQLSIYQRTGRRPRIAPADRVLWACLARAWSGWRNHLFFVKPSTVIAWQRRRFRDHGGY